MRVIAAVLLLAAAWPVEKITPSVGLLVSESGRCSAVAVTKQALLTATHCLTPRMTVNDVPVTSAGVLGDLAVVWADKPIFRPLALAPPPVVGTEVLAFGWGMGAPQPWAIPAVISSLKMVTPDDQGPYLYLSSNVIHGMSGGAIVDRRGRLVSIVLAGFTADSPLYMIGLGAVHDDMRVLVERAKEIR